MDVINWAIGSHPVSCLGMGGRQSRTGPEFGNIWDHFTVEYEYPNGIRVMSMCSQIEGSTPKVQERVLCTKGATVTDRSMGYIEDTKGRKVFTYNDPIHSGNAGVIIGSPTIAHIIDIKGFSPGIIPSATKQD